MIRIRFRSHDWEANTGTRIDHNYFFGHNYGGNFETIQIGYGMNSALYDAGTIIEYNKFENCNSDNELISLKTSGNFIRYNYLLNNHGHITIRNGENNIIEGNFIICDPLNVNSNGVRIYGANNRIINNYIYEANEFGVRLRSGDLPNGINGTITDITSTTLTDNSATWSADEYNGHNLWIFMGDGSSKQYGIADTLTNSYSITQSGDDFIADGAQIGDDYRIVSSRMPAENSLVSHNTIWMGEETHYGIDLRFETNVQEAHNSVFRNNILQSSSGYGIYDMIDVDRDPQNLVFEDNLVYATVTQDEWSSAAGEPRPAGVIIDHRSWFGF